MSDIRCPTCDSELDWGICRTCMYEYLKDKCDKQEAENERLRKVVDAVERHYDAETTEPGGRESDRTLVEMFRAVDALRELEESDV